MDFKENRRGIWEGLDRKGKGEMMWLYYDLRKNKEKISLECIY